MPRLRKDEQSSINNRERAVLYARVSSKEQEREGFSIPAQLKLLREYAINQGIRITNEYVDVETAKESGRGNFNKMVRYLKRHPNVRTLLVEKTDRLYRNLKDWLTLDELDVEIHFVKEGSVLSDNSRSSEKFIHGIKVLMAKQYIDNLSEEASKGMAEKAEQGIWPSYAPVGYMNTDGPHGKRIVVIDPKLGPIITQMYRWYVSGHHSLSEIAQKAYEQGFVTRRYGVKVSPNTIHAMLKNPFYKGDFKWRGKLYQGTHEPLVSHDLWDQAQAVLADRSNSKLRGSAHNFAFTGLITCGHCGCAVVGEIKKKKYIYYHCTGSKGKCGEPYVREFVLEEKFTELLRQLRFDDDVFHWLTEGLRGSLADQKREHEEALARLELERDRMQKRLDAMYIDKLDGRVPQEFYDRKLSEWRDARDRYARDIARHQRADDSYMDEGIALLELAKDAHRLFGTRPAEDKSKLVKMLASNCTWKNGELLAEFRQPFDLLAEISVSAASSEAEMKADSARYEVWRARQDSNLRPQA